MELKDLFTANNEGKGFRSIGKWVIVDSSNEETFDRNIYAILNEHQKTHLHKAISLQKEAVVMKETYSDKYRVYDKFSFCFWMLSNLASSLLYKEMGENEQKLYYIAYKILEEANFFSNTYIENKQEGDEK